MDLDIELRKLPPGIVFELTKILEIRDAWKQLMSLIPSDINSNSFKYTVEHINLIENAGLQQKRPCTEILFEEWGTSGQRRPHLNDLRNLLIKAELYRAADYVSELLEREAPARPLNGPAAPVLIPELLYSPAPAVLLPELLSPPAPQISDWGSLCQKETTPLSRNNNLTAGSNQVHHISYEVLEAGTCGFSDSKKLGAGGFGSVYLCFLSDKKTAVKRLYDTGAAIQGQTEVQFKNELHLFGDVFHSNVLPLLAYSSNGPYLCLVYEYMSNGSLQDALETKAGRKVLEWDERLNIALGTAKGLEYLHTMKEDRPLIHRDVKSANVLLDDNLVPKVGDFGLAKQGTGGKSVTLNTSTIVGTSAYMAPEVFRGDVSTKGDVFSFGVVLLEMITGLPPYDENREGCDLASYVDEVDDIMVLVDTRPSSANEKIYLTLYEIAQKCLQDKKLRPNSSVVVKLIEDLIS